MSAKTSSLKLDKAKKELGQSKREAREGMKFPGTYYYGSK